MTLSLDWNRLISDRRAPSTGDGPRVATQTERIPVAVVNPGRSRFEEDYDRVIFSAPFRRLAGKTQVHPFASVDHVHNRLTHTLEVASVGRSLGMAVGRRLVEQGEMPAGRTAADFSYIVQSACLAHDIGNPPFGHAGEYAIRGWAAEHVDGIFAGAEGETLKAVLADWRWFEGNAQSFRLVARADRSERDYFRFTYASLGAMIKYPWATDDARTAEQGKHNVFSSEKAVFADVVETLGLGRADGSVARHPLSFLAEAADDICYRISDFEDAVEMRILPEAEVRAIFYRIIGGEPEGPLSALRARAVGTLVLAAIETFAAHHDAIMAGERERDLKADFPANIRDAMATIKEGYESIFRHRTKVAVELGAHAILGRILAVHAQAVRELVNVGDYKKLGFVHKRCLALAWDDAYIVANQKRDAAWWLGRVMDHVAGMTDAYATQVAREIAGG